MSNTPIRPEINTLLRRLRRRIRQYVLVDALARIVALLGILFWLTFGMNWAYFKLSNLELPVGFRLAFGWISIAGSLLFAGWLILPLLKLMRDKALALVLERRFPELDDRLITAVEAAHSHSGRETDLTAHMLQNTVDGVGRAVDRLHVGEVFEQRPRRRSLTAAFVMAVSIGALAVVNLDAVKLWADAWVDFDEVYWDRQTTLVVKIIAQPGDREKDFMGDDGNPTGGLPGAYKHPRDEELVLVVEVPRRDEPGRDDWKVPDEIELDYRLAGGRGRTSVTLHRREGRRRFVHSIAGLTDSIEALYVSGGDYANRRPYRIDVVDPPRIDRVVLENDYPDYTGRDAYDAEGNLIRDRRTLKGAQISVPMETEFLLHCFGNKPLVGARLQVDVNQQDVKEIEVRLEPFRPDAAGSIQLIVTADDGARSTTILSPETAWRFRLIPDEIALAERFDEVVRQMQQIRGSSGTAGAQRLSRENAADRLEQLQTLAGRSREIEQEYRDLLNRMDRNPLYPRLMLQGMRETILAPLAQINERQLPAAEKLLETLAAEGAGGSLETLLAARKRIEEMLLATNDVQAEMSDGARFDVPFHVGARTLEQLAGGAEKLAAPIPLPPDREMRIYLEDTDDIIGASPARLTINGTPDQPPVVETRLRGIGTAITRRAVIPVTGAIRDDYGIAAARFEFLIDANQRTGEAETVPAPPVDADADQPADGAEGETSSAGEPNWRVRPFRTRPEDDPLEFLLETSPADRYPAARFEVLPLDLQIGQQLTLSVYAEDGDDLGGPHATRGEKYRFRIVSTEELLSILYGRELGIRRRFEQIIQEVEQTKADLVLHRGRLDEAEALRRQGDRAEAQSKLKEIDAAVGNAAGRSFHQVSKNHSETRDVAQSFRELLEELTNNGVHTDEQVGRIEALIVLPLDGITKDDFPAVLTTVNLFKQAHEKGADSRRQIDAAASAIDDLLLHMRTVLAEMEDLVEFHEALKDLEAMIGDQEKLRKEAREKQKKEAIEKLKKLGLD